MTLRRLLSTFLRRGILNALLAFGILCLPGALSIAAPDLDVSLSYVYPVPFRPSLGDTVITFAQLPSEGNIRIYTVTGELVRKIDFLDPASGMVRWDVTSSGGDPLGSDVYVYIVQSGDNKKIGKLVVIR